MGRRVRWSGGRWAQGQVGRRVRWAGVRWVGGQVGRGQVGRGQVGTRSHFDSSGLVLQPGTIARAS